MLTVTKEGEIIGDYWEGIRKVESTRASLVVAEKEKRQAEDFKAAVKTKSIKHEVASKPEKPKPAPKKQKLYDRIGARVEKLHKKGRTNKYIAELYGISTQTVRKYIKMQEMDRRPAGRPSNWEKYGEHIKQLHAAGLNDKEIAEEIGNTKRSVKAIIEQKLEGETNGDKR